MPPTIVQRNSADVASGAGPFTLSFSGATTIGNTIIVIARLGGTSTAAITDGSNTYNAGPGAQGSDVSLAHASFGTGYIFSAKNAASVTTITITLTGGATTVRWIIYEVNGLDTTAPLDKTSSLYTAAGSTSVNSGNTATTTTANEYLLGALFCNTVSDTSVTVGITQAYAIENSVPTPISSGTRLVTEDVNVSSTGAFQADFRTVDAGTDHIVLIATYKAALAGTPVFEDDSYALISGAPDSNVTVW